MLNIQEKPMTDVTIMVKVQGMKIQVRTLTDESAWMTVQDVTVTKPMMDMTVSK